MADEKEKKETPKAETEKPAVVETPPTPEEIKAQTEKFLEGAFGNRPPRQEAEEAEEPAKVEDEPAKEEPANEEAPKEPAPEKPKEEKPKKPYQPGAPKTAEEVETIARRVIEEREAAQADEPEAEPAKEEKREESLEDFSDEDRDRLQVLAELEATNQAYKGAVEREKKFIKAAKGRKEQWEAKHGAGTYNPEDQDHAEFYRKNEPYIPSRDFKSAERSMIAREAESRVEQRLEKKLSEKYDAELREMRAEKKRREVEPEIAGAVGDAVESIFKAVPEFEKLVEPGQLSEESVAKMKEINPVVHRFAEEEAEYLVSVVGELERLDKLGDHHQFNPQMARRLNSSGRVIYPHALIGQTYVELESKLSKASKDDRLDESGREFLTIEQRNARVDAIMKEKGANQVKQQKMQALRENYWWLGPENVKKAILHGSRQRIAAIHKDFGHLSKTTTNGEPAKNGETAASTDTQKPPAKPAAAKSTATTSVTDIRDNAAGIKGGVTKDDEYFAERAFR